MVELIQYGLGRHIKSKQKWHFAPIANKLDTLWLEVELNGRTVTIERSLRELSASARVREGEYLSGAGKRPSDLVSIDDLSNLLLARLRIPRVSVKQNDGTTFPLTFPTLMRAFVLHQEDSFGAILDKMLPEQRRSDVLGFMTQITPVARFTIEEKLGAIQQQVEDLKRRVAAVEEFLWKQGVRSLLEIQANVDQAQQQLALAQKARHALQTEIRAKGSSPSEVGRLDQLRSVLMSRKDELARAERKLAGLRSEEQRLSELISSLRTDRQRAARLRASEVVLSSVEFDVCPRCLLEITDEMTAREREGRCRLCNRTLRVTSDAVPRLAPKTEDIQLQLQEAEQVLSDVRRERAVLEAEVSKLAIEHRELSRRLDAEARAYVSPSVDALLAKSQDVASREAEVARLEGTHAQAEALEAMRRELSRLENEYELGQRELAAVSQPDQQKLRLLKDLYQDTLRKVDFPEISSVGIDPQSLMPRINRHLYIHVGTALKGLATVSYHLSLLRLSQVSDTYFPRMLVIDSPAVGDLNDANHDRLLRFLANLQRTSGSDGKAAEPEWQIILTTRRSNPDLDQCVIEHISSPDRMLLR